MLKVLKQNYKNYNLITNLPLHVEIKMLPLKLNYQLDNLQNNLKLKKQWIRLIKMLKMLKRHNKHLTNSDNATT